MSLSTQDGVISKSDSLKPDFDIAICGCGPVGQALALMLIQQGQAAHRVLLIDAKTAAAAERDARTMALSFGSQQLLANLQVTPDHASPIEQIHVSRRGHFGRTLLDCKDYGLPALGYVARYGDIIRPLQNALVASGAVMRRPIKMTTVNENADGVRLTLSDGSEVVSSVLVQAEGGTFGEQMARIEASNANPISGEIDHKLGKKFNTLAETKQDYQQTALIANITCSAPIPHRAFERFTDEGPLALLPQDQGYALVWCVRPESAQRLLAIDDSAFIRELQAAFGERVGAILSVTARTLYVLGLNVRTYATARVIHVGNAAQTLHPVAGQGLNLGLRDAAVIANAISAIGVSSPQLNKLNDARSADRQITIGLTNLMATVFTTHNRRPLPQSLLGLGLGMLDIFPLAKNVLARQMLYGRR